MQYRMRWPSPTPRTMLALHLATAAPLAALAVWFGAVDQLPFGEGRCSSCGVEGYVIAAHVAAAAWLGAVVAATDAARRGAAPGRLTIGALAAVAVFILAALLWHQLATLPAFAALAGSLLAFPFAIVWWTIRLIAWRRIAHQTGAALAAAWFALALFLPALFAWVWADRVEWLVF
jgi:hypothetical protein